MKTDKQLTQTDDAAHFKTHLQVKERSFFFAVQEGLLNSSPEITQICSIYSKKDNNEMLPSSL
jgi:hypothetical protein